MARILLVVLLLCPGLSWAGPPEPVNFFQSGIKLFIGMAIVVGVMLLFHVLNRKGFRFLENRHGGRIRIVETRAVGGRKSLCLVEVEGVRLLLGLGNDRVDCLHHFTPASGETRFERQLREEAEEQG